MPVLHPSSALGESRIAGAGLIAAAPIAAGEVVVRFDSDVTSADDLAPVNHSCDPNLTWTDDRTLVAAIDIPAGTELVTDYALRIADPSFVLFCHCETYRCRQAIEGTDWQIPQLQRRYSGWFAPAVQAHVDTGITAPG